MTISFIRQVGASHDAALLKLKEALKASKWGVLADIDLRAILKEKIGADVEAYNILDVCNPRIANEGLKASKEVGLILPCKMVVYDDGEQTNVGLYLPTKQLPEELQRVPGLRANAEEAESALKAILQSI